MVAVFTVVGNMYSSEVVNCTTANHGPYQESEKA